MADTKYAKNSAVKTNCIVPFFFCISKSNKAKEQDTTTYKINHSSITILPQSNIMHII